MDDHQRDMWKRMTSELDEFEAGRIALGELVADLHGLLIEADPHDSVTYQDFNSLWAQLDGEHEQRTEPWGYGGSDETLSGTIADIRHFVQAVVDADLGGAHR